MIDWEGQARILSSPEPPDLVPRNLSSSELDAGAIWAEMLRLLWTYASPGNYASENCTGSCVAASPRVMSIPIDVYMWTPHSRVQGVNVFEFQEECWFKSRKVAEI